MTKPMYCPMSYLRTADSMFDWSYKPMECTPDCAWAKNDGKNYWCGHVQWELQAKNNTRPLKDDVDE